MNKPKRLKFLLHIQALQQLFRLDIAVIDSVAMLLIPALFLALGWAACFWPARRAGRVEPIEILRES